jgi:hypothetical protein
MKKIEGHVFEQFKELEVGDWSRVQGGMETMVFYQTGECSDGGYCDWEPDPPMCY